eukprot:8856-Prymnesium_polylepis.1
MTRRARPWRPSWEVPEGGGARRGLRHHSARGGQDLPEARGVREARHHLLPGCLRLHGRHGRPCVQGHPGRLRGEDGH